MAKIHTLIKKGEAIYPVTHISAVVDDNGNTVEELILMEIAKVVANAPEDLDTLKEVADYIASDKTKASQIETAISNLQKADVQLANSINANAKALVDKANKSDLDELATKEKVQLMTETTASIAPNILYVWGEVAELNITLAEGEEGVVNEYMVQFTSGDTAATLTLPDSIVWMSAPNIQSNKTYQLSIINNLGVIGEFGNE